MTKKQWDNLIDQLFDLDREHPYLGQTIESDGVTKDFNECHNPEGPGGGQFCSGGLTDSEKDALYAYSDSSHINASLRAGNVPDDLTEQLKNLDSAFSKASLPSSITSYRIVDSGAWEKMQSMKAGDTFVDPTFVSTSPSGYPESKASPRYQMTISLPKGAHAIVLKDLSAYQGEDEITIGRGSKFRVTGRTFNNINLEYVL